jgi:Arc/MetJ-type ribon-helix-helix transcriptional regulator
MSFTVHLPDDLLAFAEAEVTAGHYASVADVCAAGLRLLKEEYEASEAGADATAGDVLPRNEGPPR